MINIFIDKDDKEMEYLAILKKEKGQSLSELKSKIDKQEVVLFCDVLDIEQLSKMTNMLRTLENKGARITIFEDERKVNLTFLENLVSSSRDTEKFLQETEDVKNVSD